MPPLLTMDYKKPDRLKMIEQALKAKAPKFYRELKKASRLQTFLRKRESEMMESYQEQEREIVFGSHPTNDTLKDLQKLESNLRQLWEETLAVWLEFPEEETTALLQESSPLAEVGNRRPQLTLVEKAPRR